MSKGSGNDTGLSSRKRVLLEAMLKERGVASAAPQRIPRRAKGESPPLSYAQERMWFFEQLTPGTGTYNIPILVRLSGALNVDALDRAMTEVVRRHETLRMSFGAENGSPIACIDDNGKLSLRVIDLSDRDDAETELQRLAKEDATSPFDLAEGPLIRATLFVKSETDHALLLNTHHIISEARSLAIFFREVSEFYRSFVEGEPVSLPELPVQYGDYATWQRSQLDDAKSQEQVDYWKRQFGGELPVLEVPTDRPRGAVQTFPGNTLSRKLPRDLSQRLKALGQSEQSSLFMTLIAAYKVLLHRYTGLDDLIVATPVSGRNRVELEQVIGCFVNTMALRTQIDDAASFREYLREVRTTALDAYAHQDVPFETVVHALRPERDLGHALLFQVMFVLQDEAAGVSWRESLQLPGVDAEMSVVRSDTAKFDLTLEMEDGDEGLMASFEYNTDLFDDSTIERMLSHLEVLLTGIVDNPDESIAALPLMPDAERELLMVEWNQTRQDYPRDRGIHNFFEERCRTKGDAVAVVSGELTVSYEELNGRANRLAHHLRGLGVRKGDFVATCMERSVEMVVSVLAILKAGAAYVPLDASYPRERLELMLDDAAASVVLTVDAHVGAVRGSAEHVVCLDSDWTAIQQQPDTNPDVAISAEDLAYLMFTSGSTGAPKGVAVKHGCVARLVIDSDYVPFAEDEIIPHISNCSFDAATFELWGSLCNGGRLVIISRDEVLSLRTFAKTLHETNVTAMFVTTALFNQMVATVPDAFSKMRHVLFGGETVDPATVRKLLTGRPPKRLLHVYGPTECTTFATSYLIEELAEDAQTVPIGRPIANTTCYILDRNRRPAPTGVPGELYIGGDGVALGYHNREELTAQGFIPSPFNEDERLYRTGDLVKFRSDGNIEFLGRLDHQVKIRGFRIEPGEIEVHIARHPSVKDVKVLAREDTPGDKRLVAYVVAESGTSIDTAELQTFLRELLPTYMLPGNVVWMDALPLNPNGKVDRRALPVPERERGASEDYQAPGTETERGLAAIWSELLGVERIGLQDNFFDLGGHSLMAIRVAAQVQERLGVDVPLRDFFDAPFVKDLAATVDRLKRGDVADSDPVATDPCVMPIRVDGSRDPFFCIEGTGRGGVYKGLAASLDPDMPVYALHPHFWETGGDAIGTVEEIAARYVQSVRAIQPHGPYYLGGWSFGGTVSYEMAQQFRRAGEPVAFVGLMESFATNPAKSSLGHGVARVRTFVNKVRVRLIMIYKTLPNIRGYIRDGFRLLLGGNGESVERRLSLREYLTFIWHDINRQYFLKQAGLDAPDSGQGRLAMLDDPYVRRVTNAIAHNVITSDEYAIDSYPGRVTVFRAEHDPWREADKDPTLGWAKFAEEGVEVHVVPGNHMVLLRSPFVETFAKEFQKGIDCARQRYNTPDQESSVSL